jgi:hypothetical protein
MARCKTGRRRILLDEGKESRTNESGEENENVACLLAFA